MNNAGRNDTKTSRKKHLFTVLTVVCCFLLFVAILAFYSAKWYLRFFGGIGFDSILYTVFSKADAAGTSILMSYFKRVLAPGILTVILSWYILLLCSKEKVSLPFSKKKAEISVPSIVRGLSRSIALVLSCVMIYVAALDVELDKYIQDWLNPSTFFQSEYVDPKGVTITFPEKKQNLIYIFLESMETAFFSEDQGGAGEVCYIPELYQLAENNINFSQNSSVGGGWEFPGATWTIGAMISHTAGIPLKIPPSGNEKPALPGVTSIMDILHENGYQQGLMVGSEIQFGGRDIYYGNHGIDTIWDLTSGRIEGLVPGNYFAWWGFEDSYLFHYAKEKITEMASGDAPFAFTMLTVDTHHIGGYICDLCEDTYEEQYQNVYACSSRQVADFVNWFQQQDFAENTTLVITGDHVSMDAEYISRNVDPSYERRVYNCIINPSPEVSLENTKNREFLTLDMFPTTLAAIGCTIEGEHLGLGTNLFSGEETIVERYGYPQFCAEIRRRSEFYNKELLKGNDYYNFS